MGDEGEMFVGLATQLGVSLVGVLGDGLRDPAKPSNPKRICNSRNVTSTSAARAVSTMASRSAPYSRTTESRLNPSRSRWAPCPAAVTLLSGDGPRAARPASPRRAEAISSTNWGRWSASSSAGMASGASVPRTSAFQRSITSSRLLWRSSCSRTLHLYAQASLNARKAGSCASAASRSACPRGFIGAG